MCRLSLSGGTGLNRMIAGQLSEPLAANIYADMAAPLEAAGANLRLWL